MRKIVRILSVCIGLLLVGMSIFVNRVYADGSVSWGGKGSENLPCSGGAHWVLTGANDATSATLEVNGGTYSMHQSGNGSWSADSSGPLDSSLSASASWVGDASNPSLQLSHCTGDTPTETPTNTPPPTETSTNTPPPTETSTNTPPPTETPTLGPSLTPTRTPTGPTATPEPTNTPKPENPTPTSTPVEQNTAGGNSGFRFELALLGVAFLALGAFLPKTKISRVK